MPVAIVPTTNFLFTTGLKLSNCDVPLINTLTDTHMEWRVPNSFNSANKSLHLILSDKNGKLKEVTTAAEI